jgi:hypothetical protein
VIRQVGEREKPPFFQDPPQDSVHQWINLNLSQFSKNKWIRSGVKISSTGSGYRVTRMWMLNNTDLKSKWVAEIYTNRRLTAKDKEVEED